MGGHKPGRNKPCPCGSGAKYKRCHGAPPPPPSNEPPPCSVADCDEPVEFFLSPSVDGQRSASRYWVACKGHVEAISVSAAQAGLDVDVVPFSSIEGKVLAAGGLEVVEEPVQEPTSEEASDG